MPSPNSSQAGRSGIARRRIVHLYHAQRWNIPADGIPTDTTDGWKIGLWAVDLIRTYWPHWWQTHAAALPITPATLWSSCGALWALVERDWYPLEWHMYWLRHVQTTPLTPEQWLQIGPANTTSPLLDLEEVYGYIDTPRPAFCGLGINLLLDDGPQATYGPLTVALWKLAQRSNWAIELDWDAIIADCPVPKQARTLLKNIKPSTNNTQWELLMPRLDVWQLTDNGQRTLQALSYPMLAPLPTPGYTEQPRLPANTSPATNRQTAQAQAERQNLRGLRADWEARLAERNYSPQAPVSQVIAYGFAQSDSEMGNIALGEITEVYRGAYPVDWPDINLIGSEVRDGLWYAHSHMLWNQWFAADPLARLPLLSDWLREWLAGQEKHGVGME